MSATIAWLGNFMVFFWRQQIDTKCPMPSDWRPARPDPAVGLLTAYGLSSFTYGVLGLAMLTIFAGAFELPPVVQVPMALQGSCLIVQSVATLLADVCFIGRDSVWHAIDRWMALCNVLFFTGNVYWISLGERVWFATGGLAGMLALSASRHHRAHGSTASFALWHVRWHVAYPLVVAVWLAWRVTALA